MSIYVHLFSGHVTLQWIYFYIRLHSVNFGPSLFAMSKVQEDSSFLSFY